jgi:hypothetical protein
MMRSVKKNVFKLSRHRNIVDKIMKDESIFYLFIIFYYGIINLSGN